MNLLKNIKWMWMLALVMLGACNEDFLNPEPTASLHEKEVFESYTNAKAAMVGVYDQISDYYFDGLFIPVMSDIMGEDVMVNSVDNWGWFVPVYQLNTQPNYTYNTYPWRTGYKVMYDASRIIEEAFKIPDATDEEINNLIAEAKTARAFAMLKLTHLFAPAYSADPDALSILNANRVMAHDDEDIGRSSNREIYEQIVNDLSSAVELFSEDEESADLSDNFAGFFTQRAANALLARAYLDMEKWALARDAAKAAHDGMELMSIDEMLNGFTTPNSETIFSIAYTADDNNIYASLPSFYWPVAGYSSMRANSSFTELFSETDIRNNQFLDFNEIDEDNTLILKFGHNQSVGNAEKITIRAAEMHLIEAECEAELGNYDEAQDALYLIQSRSDVGVIKSSKTGQELIDEILIERRKELFGEGFRLNDIKRRQGRLVRTGDHWVDFDMSPGDEDYYRLTLPIPQSEIDANQAISQADQNEGY